MTVGRPIEYDKEKALNKALQLFWHKGFKGTSVSDLCRETELSKSTLYAVLGDKRQIFLTSIEAYSEALLRDFLAHYESSPTPLAFVESFLRGVAAEGSGGKPRKGCLVMNSATEFAQSDPDIAKIVSRTLERMAAILEDVLTKAKQAGEIRDLDAKSMAFYLVSTVAGMKTMVKAGRPRGDLERLVDTVMQSL